MKRHAVLLTAITLLGFLLRWIGAMNLEVGADEMHFVTHAINFLSAGRLITYDQSSGLWFAFTDLMYGLFGRGHMQSRLGALLFGTLSIPVLYLLSKEFFGRTIGLAAALVLALAPFHILSTVAEMDVMAMFFVLTGMLAFMKGLKGGRLFYYVLSGASLGLSIYLKVYPVLFVPSMLLYFIYFQKRSGNRLFTKRYFLASFLYASSALLFAVPALAHNYLLYKDKGFVDVQFTRAFGLGKQVSSQYYRWNESQDWKGLVVTDERRAGGGPRLLLAARIFRLSTPLVFYVGLSGVLIITLFRREYADYLAFLLFSILFVLPFLASITLLGKHFLFLEVLFGPLVGLALHEAGAFFREKFKIKAMGPILLASGTFTLVLLGLPKTGGFYEPHRRGFYGEGQVSQMISFKNSIAFRNPLIVADTRIYRGRIHWAFHGLPYFEGKDFVPIFSRRDQLGGRIVPVDVYYLECALGDCGWGLGKISQEGHEHMEALAGFFRKNGRLVKIIEEPVYDEPYFLFSNNRKPAIRIYSLGIKMTETLPMLASQPKHWFLYTIGYGPAGSQFDDYGCPGFPEQALNGFAHGVALLALALSVLGIFYPFYLLYEDFARAS